MVINTKKMNIHLTLEMVLSAICFLAGIAFLVAALMGTWRHFVTMGLCFAIGIMITDDGPDGKSKQKRHSK